MPHIIPDGSFAPAEARKLLDFAGPIGPGAPKVRALFVQEALTLAGFACVPDGSFGNATKLVLQRFQTSKGLSPTGICDAATFQALAAPFLAALVPVAGGTFADVLVNTGLRHCAQHPREIGGDNKGPWVRLYMRGEHGPNWLWCAGFVSFLISQAMWQCKVTKRPIEWTVSCDTLAADAKAKGIFVPERDVAAGRVRKSAIQPGSLFLVRKTVNDWTHVGMVLATREDTFDTIEGNTNDDGSRDGYEAVVRVRDYKNKDFVVFK